MLALRTLLFTLLFPGTVTVAAPWLLVHFLDAGTAVQPGPVAWLALVLIAGGVGIYTWCAWDFAAHGRGTPAPYDPPRKLIARGLYRLVRNSMYVGIVLILAGEAVLLRTVTLAVYAGAILLAFHLRAVVYEEPTLRRLFGAEFERYQAAVPRWRLRPM